MWSVLALGDAQARCHRSLQLLCLAPQMQGRCWGRFGVPQLWCPAEQGTGRSQGLPAGLGAKQGSVWPQHSY